MNPFEKANRIIAHLKNNGHQAYLVGGSVRDYLIGREVGDLDIATSARPNEVSALFEKVIPIGIEHGTVLIRFEHESFEITTFRTEGTYSDSRHPDSVHFVTTIEEDLARRDFTINAIAMDEQGLITDPYHGKAAIEAKIIQTVGNAYERFHEDPLRMMRGIRFAAQLGFELDEVAIQVMEANKQWLSRIAVERIATEFEKLCGGSFVNKGFQLMEQTKLDQALPVLKDYPGLIAKLKDRMLPLVSMAACIALFCCCTNSEADRWTTEWKLSNKVKKEASSLVSAINFYRKNSLTNWLVYQLPPELDHAFTTLIQVLYSDKELHLDEIKAVRQALPIQHIKQLTVSGKDLTSWFPESPKGPWIRGTLTAIERKVAEGQLPNKQEAIKEWVINGQHTQSVNSPASDKS